LDVVSIRKNRGIRGPEIAKFDAGDAGLVVVAKLGALAGQIL